MVKEKKTNLLKNKDFMLLFLGGFVSRIGNSIHYIALTWFILETTGSGTATGTILFLGSLPGVLLGPFSGVVADRVNRKFLIVGMDIVRGLVVLWLSWAVYYNLADFSQLAIATVLIGISSAFFNPAVSATLPNLVTSKNLQQANSYEHFSMQFSSIIGAATGGILLAIFGVAGVFLIDGLTYLMSAFSELFINIPEVKRNTTEKVTFVEDLKFGAKFLYNNKTLFSMFSLSIFLNFLFAGVMVVGLPYIFKEVLAVNSKLFGISQSIFPLGAVLGALILGFIPEVKNYYRVLLNTIGLQALTLFSLGLPILPLVMNHISTFTSYVLLLVILFFFGAFNALGNVPISVLLQRLIPDNVRGRIFGLITTFNQGLVPISMAFIGWMLDLVPTYILFMVAGLGVLIIIVAGFQLKAIKKLDTNDASVIFNNQKNTTQSDQVTLETETAPN